VPSGASALLPARPPGGAAAALSTAVLSRRVGAAGLCSDSNSDRWFPQRMLGWKARVQYAAYARAACLGCSVIEECLELALRIEARPRNGSHGVWGGTAPWERAAMICARRASGEAAS
jgi:hypothetical protein